MFSFSFCVAEMLFFCYLFSLQISLERVFFEKLGRHFYAAAVYKERGVSMLSQNSCVNNLLFVVSDKKK